MSVSVGLVPLSLDVSRPVQVGRQRHLAGLTCWLVVCRQVQGGSELSRSGNSRKPVHRVSLGRFTGEGLQRVYSGTSQHSGYVQQYVVDTRVVVQR